jgi:hypothetical protein
LKNSRNQFLLLLIQTRSGESSPLFATIISGTRPREHGEAYAADLKKQLLEAGQVRFHIEIIEGYLKLHGIEPQPNESFVMTVARALGIDTAEVGVRMQEGTFGRDLWNKFGDVNNATEKDSIGSAQAKASSGMP